MRLDESVIKRYIELQESLELTLKKHRISKKDVYEGIQMPARTFNYKFDRKTFTPSELLRIAEFINQLP